MFKSKHFVVGSLCILGTGLMFSLPYIIRVNTVKTMIYFIIIKNKKPIGERDMMTGSQRQRGMYMNAGSHGNIFHKYLITFIFLYNKDAGKEMKIIYIF